METAKPDWGNRAHPAHLLDVIVIGILTDLQQLVVIHTLGLLEQKLCIAQRIIDAWRLRLHALDLQPAKMHEQWDTN